MGKLSDDDYADIRSRYRERAVRILRQLDQGQSYEQQIERDLAARREAIGKKAAPASKAALATSPASTEKNRPASDERPTVIATACADCGTRNDIDARFCKSCGQRLGGRA
jgi:uncharacterized membrane protein